jgi:hypothetical protein
MKLQRGAAAYRCNLESCIARRDDSLAVSIKSNSGGDISSSTSSRISMTKHNHKPCMN